MKFFKRIRGNSDKGRKRIKIKIVKRRKIQERMVWIEKEEIQKKKKAKEKGKVNNKNLKMSLYISADDLYDQFTIFLPISFSITFWINATIFMILDFSPIFSFLRKYKIEPEPNEVLNKDKLMKVSK